MKLNIQLFATEISTAPTSVTLGNTIRINIYTDLRPLSYKITLMFYVYDSKTDPVVIDVSDYITGTSYDYTVKENIFDVLQETTGTLMILGLVEDRQGEFIEYTNTINLILTVLKLPTKLVNVNSTLSALAIGGKSTAEDDEELYENYMASKFYKDIEVTNVVSRNLFNKNNVYILNAALDAGSGELSYSDNFRTFRMKINPNTTYSISKIVSSRFVLGFYSSNTNILPIVLNNVTGANNATKLTVTSGDTDNYLYVMYSKVSEDTTIAQEDILNSIQVEENSTASDYIPYLNLQENILTDSVARLNNVVSRNLFNKNNYFYDSNGVLGFRLNLELGKTYTISSNKPLYIAKFAPSSGDDTNNKGPEIWNSFTSWTFVAGNNTNNYLNNNLFLGVQEWTWSTNINDFADYDIQVEEGTTATNYVPYLNLEEAMQKEEIYSTSEVRIGTWLGKPLYRKVITETLDLSATGLHYATTGISNLDLVINIDYTIDFTNINIKQYTFNNAISSLGIDKNNANNIFMYTNVAWDSNMPFTFIVEYTKTTD